MAIEGRRIRLADWGRQYGRDPRTTWQMYKDGRLPADLVVEKVGRILYVCIPESESVERRTVLYARVSSHSQSEGLIRQAERLQKHARKQGWDITEVVMETGSGLNGKRRKLLNVLRDEVPLRLVVEHRDRLTRFGFEMLEAAVQANGGVVVVVDDSEVDDDLVRDVTEVLTSMCARLYGKRSAARRAEKALEAAAS